MANLRFRSLIRIESVFDDVNPTLRRRVIKRFVVIRGHSRIAQYDRDTLLRAHHHAWPETHRVGRSCATVFPAGFIDDPADISLLLNEGKAQIDKRPSCRRR
jgi:hypothetical protein